MNVLYYILILLIGFEKLVRMDSYVYRLMDNI